MTKQATEAVTAQDRLAKSPGQLAYEEDVRRCPTYASGKTRRRWTELSEEVRRTWEDEPTARSYQNTYSRPVMNSPADEAEARDRAQAAPSPADPDAGCRGVSGLTSGSEARPVTPTARHLAEPCPQMMKGIGCSKPHGHAGPHEFAEDFL